MRVQIAVSSLKEKKIKSLVFARLLLEQHRWRRGQVCFSTSSHHGRFVFPVKAQFQV